MSPEAASTAAAWLKWSQGQAGDGGPASAPQLRPGSRAGRCQGGIRGACAGHPVGGVGGEEVCFQKLPQGAPGRRCRRGSPPALSLPSLIRSDQASPEPMHLSAPYCCCCRGAGVSPAGEPNPPVLSPATHSHNRTRGCHLHGCGFPRQLAASGSAAWLGAATCVPNCCCPLPRRCSCCAAGVHSSLRCWWHLRQLEQEQQAEEQPRAPLLHPLQQQLGMPVHQPVLAGAAGTAVSAVMSAISTLLMQCAAASICQLTRGVANSCQ